MIILRKLVQIGTKYLEAVSKDSRIGKSHMKPYHKTSGKIGRGPGGHCFMKDFEAFIEGYSKSNKKIF